MADKSSSGDAELFAPVAREPRLSDKVAELMRETILSRNMAPGTPLPSERELGEQFGVSRTVIREAVRALAAKGIVEVRTGSGLRVASVDESAALESLTWYIRGGQIEYAKVHEVRSTIEVEMAGLAAERRTEEQLSALQGAHKRFNSVLDDVEQATLADVEFHGLIARATQNDLFSVLLASIGEALIEVRHETLAVGSGKKTLQAHAKILAAIERGDSDQAREAMRLHLNTVRDLWSKRATPVAAVSRR
jgi:GntR family transcriptional regulator, transcriptional repressor for pyruvate dehydrogenase complex